MKKLKNGDDNPEQYKSLSLKTGCSTQRETDTGGRTMTAGSSDDRIMSGKTWHDFCDTIKKAGDVIMRETSPADPLTRAEGFRYLSRIMRATVEAFIEYSDPLAPVLFRPIHETAKLGADNPDNYYQHATISGKHEYRIYGTRGTVHHLTFGSYKGNYGMAGASGETGFLDGKDLAFNSDGSFEIILSHEKKGTNWLKTEDETSSVIVRQTFADRASETIANIVIERINGDGKPSPFTPEGVDRSLTMASNIMLGAATLFANWAEGFRQHTNELPLFNPETSLAAHGDPTITYYHSYWKISEDEALVIDALPPECDAWNFQLNNYWMESLDYRYYPVWVNQHTARYRPDGSVRIIVSHRDPGTDNWVDTVGHVHGTMLFRWVKADKPVQPVTRLVKFSDIGSLD